MSDDDSPWRSAQRKGIEQGLQQGIGQGQARLLTRVLEQRFGPVPADIAARLQAAGAEPLEVWGRRVLAAAVLEEVFRPDPDH